jgi:hypothetical protein
MDRTCIICGVAANSREHVFPAALGGRRTNKGIYCEKHNGEYSGLADIIANQMRFFNSQLGVVGDHQKSTGEVKPVLMVDSATNAEVWLTNNSTSYAEPRILSSGSKLEGGKSSVLAVNSKQELNAYVAEMKAKGIEIRIDSVGESTRYYAGTLERRLELGGNDTGLRAITYIAQTFLAHTFPELARLPALASVKKYTLTGAGNDFAWWLAPTNHGLDAVRKPFNHQVIVGHNADDNVIYARVSLFGALHYGVALGRAPTAVSRAVVFDIDPLTMHAPHDVQKTVYQEAVGYVLKPKNLTENLSVSIKNGHAKAAIDLLMKNIEDHRRAAVARKWLQELARVQPDTPEAANLFFERLVSEESGHVLRLLESFKLEFIRSLSATTDEAIPKVIDYMNSSIVRDPSSFDGLTPYGRMLLKASSSALKRRLMEAFVSGQLDQHEMEMFLSGGRGQHAVGTAVLDEAFIKLFGFAWNS